MASRHAPHTQDKARSRAALGVIGVCAVLGLLTVLEGRARTQSSAVQTDHAFAKPCPDTALIRCAHSRTLTFLAPAVHRSHNDVHALRISKQAAGVRFDETSKESQFTRSPSFRLSTLPPVNQQTSAALTTAQQAAAGAVQAASTLGLQPGHSVGSVGKPLRAAIRSVEERIEDLIDDEKDGIDPMCHFEVRVSHIHIRTHSGRYRGREEGNERQHTHTHTHTHACLDSSIRSCAGCAVSASVLC